MTTRLQRLEDVIERGLKTFLEVGQALAEIRDQRLYKAHYTTFDQYLRERWRQRLSRSYASRLIQAAQVVALLPVGNRPTTERVARELVPLADQPDVLREVWDEVRAMYGADVPASIVGLEVAGRLMAATAERWMQEAVTDQALTEMLDARIYELEHGVVGKLAETAGRWRAQLGEHPLPVGVAGLGILAALDARQAA